MDTIVLAWKIFWTTIAVALFLIGCFAQVERGTNASRDILLGAIAAILIAGVYS